MSVTVNSSIRVSLVSGSGVNLNAPVVPNFTSDDVYYVNDMSKTVTDVLDAKQGKIGGGAITASDADINTLATTAVYGLVANDLKKLADVNASAAEINRLVGVTSDVQTQLTALNSGKVTGAGVNLTGLTVSASQLNSFFGTPITATASELNLIHGMTSNSTDLNVLAGVGDDVLPSDLVKLGDVTASAAEINSLTGFTGDSTDLNKIVGLDSSTDDLNAIEGLSGTGVTATELAFLSGLSTNVNTFISAQPNLSGLTASVSDLSLLAGAATGSGAYSAGSLSATELSYVNGVTSPIQTQLNGKSATGHTHGIAEIVGASVTTTELNYLQSATGNIQTQINTLTNGKLSLTGGTLTGALSVASGSAAAPSVNFSSSATTGLYRASSDTIGVAVAGAAFGSIGAGAVQFGIGTTGAPYLRAQTPSATDPTYAFIGDPDTGMYRVGANSLGFTANATNYMTIDAGANTITIGGAAATNTIVNVSGMFQGVRMIGSSTINCTSTANFTIYTVPTGRRLLVTSIYIVASNIVGSGTVPGINFGVTGTFNQIVDAVSNPNLFSSPVAINTTSQVLPLGVGANSFPAISGGSGANYQFLSAGQVLTARTVTPTTGYSTYTVTAYVFGYEF